MTVILDLPPAVKVRDQSFIWNQQIEASRTNGRFVDTKADPFPYWTATFDLVPLLEADYGRFLSFTMKARAGYGFFRGYDTGRPRPLAMNTGSVLSGTRALGAGAFDGTATIDAITDSRNITISGLPADFIFTEGDKLEIAASLESLSLHMIGEDAVANSSGVVDLNLNNPIDIQSFDTNSTVNLEKPSCLMQIIEAPSHSKGPKFGTGSFEAQEMPR